ncbi:MAG: 16S rRNA (adenine(1518)-N(6)/adenine(1519)-N(6))-dimethyltransferase RsmA, partial [Coriobacteriia bacterium]|nr:16S rRNA (adenine(1518)-N(6)/adenine(1519)-N(6))-dimethyltransferase RsmA [Coriobacteriia bacterium]
MLHSHLATPKATLETLQAFGLYTKKRLGQHFLIDDNVIGRILDAAQVAESDQLLEIGPGIGVLTVALLRQLGDGGRLLALEYDAQLIEVLKYTTSALAASHETQGTPKLTILNEDALNIPKAELPLQPTKLIANLPYQVAATNVLDCFEYLPSMQQATVMVQRE